jgi:hypothetical protein
LNPRLLFVSLLAEPGAERLIHEFAALGAACDVAASPDSFAARTSGRRRLFALPRRGGHALRALALSRGLDGFVAAARPDLVIPLDELAAAVLRDGRLLARAHPDTRRTIAVSLGAPEHFPVARNRWRLCALARELGLRTPRAAALPDLAAARRAAAAFGYPLVVKRELTCGGGGALIARDAAELERGWRRSQWRARAKWALRGIAGFRIEGAAHIAQEFVCGRLAFRDLVCRDGVVLAGVDFEAEPRDGFEIGPSRFIRRIENAEMAAAARAVVAALRLSGFLSFDFLLDVSGHAHLIEMNPRATGSAHLGRRFGADLPAALLGARGLAPQAAPDWIAIYPRALAADAEDARFSEASDAMLDAPSDDPGLIEAYRRWLDARNPRAARRLDGAAFATRGRFEPEAASS